MAPVAPVAPVDASENAGLPRSRNVISPGGIGRAFTQVGVMMKKLEGRNMRVVAVMAGVMLWGGLAEAGPGVIVTSGVEAFTAPSKEATVAAALGRGAEVCVLDKTSYPGVLIERIG